MAAKPLYFKTILTSYLLNVERARFPYLKRDIHFRRGILSYLKEKKFSKTFKILAGTAAAYVTLSYLLSDLDEQQSIKRAAQLKAAGLRRSCNFIADVVEVAADAVVQITLKDQGLFFPQIKAGSGFIVRSDGLIVTNAHVVGNQYGRNVQITLRNGKSYTGVVKYVDEVTDLALVHINGKNLPVLKLGSGNDLRPGEWVAAIGSPLFLSNSVTAGVVSSVHRRAAEIGLPNGKISYIQTDTTVVGGNSGGPLVNLDGEVVGVNTMTVTPGISFAIPVEYVKLFLKLWNAKSHSVTSKYYIGLSYIPLSPSTIHQLSLKGAEIPENIKCGMYVWNVEPNSPAFQSGIKPGDVIFQVEDDKINSLRCLYDKFEKKESVTIMFYRSGSYYKTTLTPKKQS